MDAADIVTVVLIVLAAIALVIGLIVPQDDYEDFWRGGPPPPGADFGIPHGKCHRNTTARKFQMILRRMREML